MQSAEKAISLQNYQAIIYDRSLHPEFFRVTGRLANGRGGFDVEAWLSPGRHVLRFSSLSMTCSEVITDEKRGLPTIGRLENFMCAGERDFEHDFSHASARYMISTQTEQLSDHIYTATVAEFRDHAEEFGPERCVTCRWKDDVGECFSMLDVQVYNDEIHAQGYHAVAQGRFVLRTQSLVTQR